ncbi:MAG TPA: helix-turn-helix domain-containing protein [Gaiellaceae bacterium]|nr:helix-turn-helix domain-containing protein [Gaiellaceae bacterium]
MTREHVRPCPTATALEVLGEKWSLLVVRELALGVRRFDAIQRNTGAPRDILTARLRRLEAEGVLEKRRYQEHPERFEYHLTDAGKALRPLLLMLAQWGVRWAAEAPIVEVTHSCGERLELVPTCRACGEEIRAGHDVTLRYVGDWEEASLPQR